MSGISVYITNDRSRNFAISKTCRENIWVQVDEAAF